MEAGNQTQKNSLWGSKKNMTKGPWGKSKKNMTESVNGQFRRRLVQPPAAAAAAAVSMTTARLPPHAPPNDCLPLLLASHPLVRAFDPTLFSKKEALFK